MRPRILKLQLARRTLQVLVLGLILLVPAMARYNNYLSARELDKTLQKWEGTLQGNALSAIDGSLRALPSGERERGGRIERNRDQVLRYAQSLRGGPWSMELGPLSLTDPLAVAESSSARKKVSKVLWVGALVPLIIAILLGKVFCSWICPMGFLLEMSDKLRRPLRWLEIQPADLKVWRGTKYLLLVVGLLFALVFSIPILTYVYPPAIVGRELHDLVFGVFDRAEMGNFGWWFGGLTWMSLLLLAIAAIEVTVSKRWWCRYLCPGGALYGLLGWLRPLRVQLDLAKCTSCGACNQVCHLGLRPMHDEMGPECDNCGLCISSCGDDAIAYALDVQRGWHGRPRDPEKVQLRGLEKTQLRGAIQDAGTKLGLALLVTLGLSAYGAEAQAHHILGIPHYAYDERYPQVPVLTYRVEAGEYTLELTGYPGRPAPNEQCFLNVYIRARDSGANYDGPVTIEVMRDRFVGRDPVIYGPVTAEVEEAVYKFYPRFGEEANYILRISYEVEGVPWIIDLPMVVGEPSSPWRVLIGVGGGLGLFVLLIRALKIKQRRRELATGGTA